MSEHPLDRDAQFVPAHKSGREGVEEEKVEISTVQINAFILSTH